MLVKYKRFRQITLNLGNFPVRADLRWIDNRHIQPGLNGMVQKDTVHHFAGSWREPKRDIADPKRGVHTRHSLLYQRQTLQGFQRGLPVDFLTGSQGEGQVIEDQVLRS